MSLEGFPAAEIPRVQSKSPRVAADTAPMLDPVQGGVGVLDLHPHFRTHRERACSPSCHGLPHSKVALDPPPCSPPTGSEGPILETSQY